MKEGDKNTRFFHFSTVIRRRRNAINAIKSDNEEWLTDKADIKEFFVLKFNELFTEEPISFPSNLEDLISPSITPLQNEDLCLIWSPREIKDTIFSMYNLKASRPNGLPALFYKKYWSIVGSFVINVVQSFFKSGHMLSEVNNSFIVLIPKNKSPSIVNHFRPITLCNIIYKTIAKLLVNKMRPLLMTLISPCQSAFIPDQWIIELIVQELLHNFKKKKVKGSFVAMKVDLQKAYNRENW